MGVLTRRGGCSGSTALALTMLAQGEGRGPPARTRHRGPALSDDHQLAVDGGVDPSAGGGQEGRPHGPEPPPPPFVRKAS